LLSRPRVFTSRTALLVLLVACTATPPVSIPPELEPDATDPDPAQCPPLAEAVAAGEVSLAAMFPTPHHVVTTGELGPVAAGLCLDPGDHPLVAPLASELFALPHPSGCDCTWSIAISSAPPALDDAATAAWSHSTHADRFALVTQLVGGRARTTLHAATDRGAWYGLLAAHQLIQPDGRIPAAVVVDYPEFAARGILEGYYGTPYTRAQRDTTLRLAAHLRQDTYLYGPKTDDFARVRWAEPYPAELAADLAAAAATARAHLVTFVWSISPGLPFGHLLPGDSIEYGSDADFARLTAKLDSVRALGIDHFALFLDDLAGFLPHTEDAARFASLADAHVFLINRLDDYLHSVDPEARLIVVGAEYTSLWPTWRAYNETLGAGVHAGVEVLWTGPGIYSDRIAPADLTAINATLHRQVSLWDNKPQTVGPITGRAPDLAGAARAIYSNPVINELDLHPVEAFWQIQGTLADYAWNPPAYQPDASFERWTALRAP